jgi:hypothetical protein
MNVLYRLTIVIRIQHAPILTDPFYVSAVVGTAEMAVFVKVLYLSYVPAVSSIYIPVYLSIYLSVSVSVPIATSSTNPSLISTRLKNTVQLETYT